MKYFKITSEFFLPNGNQNITTIIQSCEDLEYDNEIEKAKLNIQVSAKRMCNNILPQLTFVIENLTLTNYKKFVPTVIQEDLGDIEQFKNELEN